MHIHSYLGPIWCGQSTYKHVFRRWMKTGVCEGNPHKHRDMMQHYTQSLELMIKTPDPEAVRQQHYCLLHHAATK